MVPISAKKLFAGLWQNASENLMIYSVATDSRAVTKGSVFVAIKGERVDGHDYAKIALENGAKIVLCEREIEGVPQKNIVLCENILDAMICLGANYRAQFAAIMLGVTGSVGKTTTKDFCAAVFSSFGETIKTEGNQNNEIGVPNTLFRIDGQTKYAVVEMGMQAPLEIHKLSVAARLNAAIITRIGTSHMGSLGSIDNILKAKLEICDGLDSGAPLVLNGDDLMLKKAVVPAHVKAVFAGLKSGNEVRAQAVQVDGVGQHFTLVDDENGSFDAYIPALGLHNINNALLAYTAATRLGLAPKTAAQALAKYHATGMRQAISKKFGMTLIEDCYNASPESMRAALSILLQMPVIGRRVAVLGDMLELGATAEEKHRDIGKACAENKIDCVITVGTMAAMLAQEAEKAGIFTKHCKTNNEAAETLAEYAQVNDAVLFKASRGMKFEEIIDAFVQGKTN